MPLKKKLLGHIGVDAGLVWIGDPCYILHKDTPRKSIGNNWLEFCNLLPRHDAAKSFTFDGGHEGLGVCVGHFGGDGTYPVYGHFTPHGSVKRITIEFDPIEFTD